jgi:hypothetical protein
MGVCPLLPSLASSRALLARPPPLLRVTLAQASVSPWYECVRVANRVVRS